MAPTKALEGELLERWAAGRLAAVREAPYLATVLLALRPLVVEVPGSRADPDAPLHCFPVDTGWRVHVDPVRLAVTPPRELAYWLLHQVAHLVRDHHARGVELTADGASSSPLSRGRGSESVRRWAVAADLEVNDDLPADLRPDDDLRAGRLGLREGRVAEEYWSDLAGVALAGVRDCGGGAAGHPAGGAAAQQAMGTEEARLLREETARRISRWARAHDDLPGGWRRWADEMLAPVVDWRRELRTVVRRGVGSAVGRVDHTYLRRSRRDGAVPGVVLPGTHQPEAVVSIVIDTSQSMSQAQLDRAVAEISGIVGAAGVARRNLTLLCCDAAAFKAGRGAPGSRLQLLGGGGTDLRVGLAAAGRLRPRPGVVIVLTDGWTDWPDRPPRGTRVIVALVDGDVRPPHWAQVVDIVLDDIEDEGERRVGDRS